MFIITDKEVSIDNKKLKLPMEAMLNKPTMAALPGKKPIDRTTTSRFQGNTILENAVEQPFGTFRYGQSHPPISIAQIFQSCIAKKLPFIRIQT